jgi:small-conductance mechanosensitive channel
MDLESLKKSLIESFQAIWTWAQSPDFYSQVGMIVLAIAVAYLFARFIKTRIPLFKQLPEDGALLPLRQGLYRCRDLLFPLFTILALGIAIETGAKLVAQPWLIRTAQSLAVVFMLYMLIRRFISAPLIRALGKWVAIPVAILHVFGWLDDVTAYLDSLSFQLGNIRISAYGLARVFIFGIILFWLGKVSSETGQQIIRRQETLDIGTREVFAKLFEVVLFVVLFILLLQVVGINLTALAVFGGALGVGLGFGLQSIASNFISGIIILLDRSLTVGDYIEMEDGRAGTIRELKMRSTTLETFDGKDIMVPNESFITTSFINWTHKNKKQRYPLHFSVAYKTDLPKLFEIVRQVVASHPMVLSGPDIPIEERPDAEISSFGDFGIEVLVEFWMEGIDDGKNRVGADLLLMIWNALRENDIEIPFPQREVRILNPSTEQKNGLRSR